jgi:electron transport complex protein RnfG
MSRLDIAFNFLRLTLVLTFVSTGIAEAQTTREEALAQAFPGADIRAERVFLTEAQRSAAQAQSGVEVPSLLIARYVATESGDRVGSAYVDTHVVRTKNESLLISLDTEGQVKRIEVTAFLEPPQYMAPGAWLAQYDGQTLNEDLNLNRAIRPIAGATLTARATTTAVRRVLAINAVLND